MDKRNLAILSIIIAAICTGATPVFAKIALAHIPPFSFTFLRFLTASLILTPFLMRESKGFINIPTNVLLLSFIQVANVIFYSFGVRLTSATSAQILFSAVPLLVTILSFKLMKKDIDRNKIIGVVIGFIGALLIIILPVINKQSAVNSNLIGNMLISVSVICLAVYSIFSKKFQNKYSPLYLTTMFIYLATLTSGFLAVQEVILHPFWWNTITSFSWISVVITGFLGASFFLLYQYAIKYSSPIAASTTQYLAPVVTLTIASILLSEHITIVFAINAVLILFGVYLVTRKSTSQK